MSAGRISLTQQNKHGRFGLEKKKIIGGQKIQRDTTQVCK